MGPVLALDNVSYAREGAEILRGLTFGSACRRIGIVGRNGSGKSTLARLLAGLIAPTSGKVNVAGVDTASDRKAALKAVGILFQNPDHQIIFPTVEEELAFGLTQTGMPKDEAARAVAALLNRFGKQGWMGASTQSLSQGQRHLLCLLAVLAMRPQVIVLDEPYAGLDIPTRMQLTRVLNQAEAALVHITHEPATLADYEQVIWLERGQILRHGAAGVVLAEYTARMAELGGQDDLAVVTG